MPRVRIAVGCHPHNAKYYDDGLEADLRRMLKDPRVAALGEIGLDYHYDFSPRDDQREAFRRQLRFPEAGTLLHCFNLDWATLDPWVEAGCYVAFGGALTFKNADDTREAAARVPADRLLTETDAPYMTPEPMRGMTCLPDHVLFTAERLAEACGRAPGTQREEFLARLMDNARELLDRPATAWQKNKGA